MLNAPRVLSRFMAMVVVALALSVSSAGWFAQSPADNVPDPLPLPLPPPPDGFEDSVPQPQPMEPIAETTAEPVVMPDPEATAEPAAPVEDDDALPLPPEPESTAEPELTPEPETTAEPVIEEEEGEGEPEVVAFIAEKLDGALVQALEYHIAGDEEGALRVAEEFYLSLDRQSRVRVLIWASGQDGTGLAPLITERGGRVEQIDGGAVYARLSLGALAELSLEPAVSVIVVQPRIVASGENTVLLRPGTSGRAPVGNTNTEAYDLLGVHAWHQAGHLGGTQGDRVRIALIDVGFGTTTNVDANLSCYRSTSISFAYPAGGVPQAGDSPRGRRMAEVICDIAPESNLRFYKVNTVSDLFNAVQLAAQNSRVIVIGADMGVHTSPGDGTLGYTSANNPYTAIQNAVNAGIVVIAAAGNNGEAYRSFTYTGGTTTVTLQVPAGGTVNMSWSDWAGTRDISANLSGAGFSTLNKPSRGSGLPGHQFTVPQTCVVSAGLCTVTLTLTGFTGSGNLTVQVQGTGANSRITGITGGTFSTTAGNIGRPADSPDVIAVGAVCAQTISNYPTLDYSPRGPVFNTGGGLPPAPNPILTRGEVKPDIVAPAHVSVSSVGASNCSSGFGGTEAAAAHVAGMAAVLISNPNINTFKTVNTPIRLRDYLQTRAFEMPFTAPDGFDMQFGAGFAVLGRPDFPVDASFTPPAFPAPDRIPSGQCLGGIVYAGPQNVGAPDMDGSIGKPYTQLAHAIRIAAQQPNRCVVALPGEYNAPILMTDTLANPVSVYAYSSVSSFIVGDSIILLQNGYTGPDFNDGPTPISAVGGVYLLNTSGHRITGFVFRDGRQLESTIFGREDVSAVVFHNADNVRLSDNRFNNFRIASPIIQVLVGSEGVNIFRNEFINNRNRRVNGNATGNMTLISVLDSGGASNANRVKIERNTIEDNESVVGSQTIRGVRDLSNNISIFPAIVGWRPLIRTVNSYTDIVNNTFARNQFETLITAATRERVQPFVTRIYGNAFVANVSRSEDGGTPGPLVHLFNMQNIQFVNNTVANNNLSASTGNFGMVVGRGNDNKGNYEPAPASGTGSLDSPETRWDLHNNFMFNNIMPGGVVNDMELLGVQCKSALQPATDHTGLTHNFIFSTGPLIDGTILNQFGVCGTSAATPANNNIVNVDPYPLDEDGNFIPGSDRYIQGGDDPTLPGFYALSRYVPGTNPQGTPDRDGVDEGSNTLIDSLGFPEFIAVGATDARGMARLNQGQDSLTVDMGAYEYTPLTLSIPPSFTFNEDSGVFTFNLVDFVQGGFPPYNVIVTQQPRYFGTHCDNRFTTAARGLVINTVSADTVLVSYCPPVHFHTTTNDPTFLPNRAGFDLTLRDGSNATATGEVRYVVNPVNDAPLATVIDYERAVGIGRSDTVRLRPFVDFSNNFFFSETNNEVDYDFTYSLPTLVADPGNVNEQVLVDALSWDAPVRGIIRFDLTAASVSEAQARFSYTATDRNNNTVTNFITVRAVVPPAPFNQLTPADGTVISNQSEFTTLTWQASSGATTYSLLVYRELIEDTVIDRTGLTPANDADRLTCDATTCTYTFSELERTRLISANYSWVVTADNLGAQTVASNAPLTFTMAVGEELLRNGSFEIAGATGALAQNWRFVRVQGDRRLCNNANRTVSYEGNCALRMSGRAGKNAVVVQNINDTNARIGDEVVFSGWVSGRNPVNGDIRLRVFYKDNTPTQVFRLAVPRGTYDYFRFEESLVVNGPVDRFQVQIRSRNGSGNFFVDALSLVLKREQNFRLQGPINDSVYVDPSSVSVFKWQTSGAVGLYDFTLIERSIVPVTVLELTNLTAANDGDALTCAETVCRLDIRRLPSPPTLTAGRYEWTVTAISGVTALNAPFNFVIDGAAQEMVVNGTFEGARNNANQPQGWLARNVQKARVQCDNVNRSRFFAYQGTCAYQIGGNRPTNTTVLRQNLDKTGVVPGTTLNLRVYAAARNARNEAGRVQLTVNYTNGTRDRITLRLPGGTYDYTDFTGALTVTGEVRNIVLILRHVGDRGWVRFDNVSVSR